MNDAARIKANIASYHTAPVDVAKVAAAAGMRVLVFQHLIPGPPSIRRDAAFIGDAARDFFRADPHGRGWLSGQPSGAGHRGGRQAAAIG
jgi:hypothetical protein